MLILYITSVVILNLILFYNLKFISKKINLYDFPDKIRKFHKLKTPLLGGFFLFISISIFFSVIIYSDYANKFFNFDFLSIREQLIFFFLIFLIFILGILDDKYDVRAGHKIIYLIIFSYFIILSNENFLLKSLRFKSFEKEIDLLQYSFFFTTLSIVIFINAMNMFDGINLQASSYYLIFYIILIFINPSLVSICIIVFLLFFIFYNSSGKIFLGDSGVYLLSLIGSLSLIYIYNINNLFVEDIAVIIMLPIIDFFRLLFTRLIKNKNPMIPDRNHIHHIMLQKFTSFKIILLLNFLVIMNLINYFYLKINILITIIIFILLYSFLLKKK